MAGVGPTGGNCRSEAEDGEPPHPPAPDRTGEGQAQGRPQPALPPVTGRRADARSQPLREDLASVGGRLDDHLCLGLTRPCRGASGHPAGPEVPPQTTAGGTAPAARPWGPWTMAGTDGLEASSASEPSPRSPRGTLSHLTGEKTEPRKAEPCRRLKPQPSVPRSVPTQDHRTVGLTDGQAAAADGRLRAPGCGRAPLHLGARPCTPSTAGRACPAPDGRGRCPEKTRGLGPFRGCCYFLISRADKEAFTRPVPWAVTCEHHWAGTEWAPPRFHPCGACPGRTAGKEGLERGRGRGRPGPKAAAGHRDPGSRTGCPQRGPLLAGTQCKASGPSANPGQKHWMTVLSGRPPGFRAQPRCQPRAQAGGRGLHIPEGRQGAGWA